ncbi:MFS transporter [Brochothrix thermosphacta]|uniref:DHA2 family efflux MFS transporter permease subunit n=1 Tax=Brochothrix thermosphacta TaxID=2756 RepID=UPI00083FB801|nr:DHA2 family efflux MFS transporter permease subunit [Brochothrix thermosphacta]ODJ53761.1 MFS transporter [Brochothrix thermosphacta]
MSETHTQTNKPKVAYGVLVVLMLGAFVALLSNTLLNIALPSIMKDFNVSAATVQWLSTGYMLVNGILVPTTAFLIKKFSARQLFITAMALFTTGTLIAGFAGSFSILLTGRMVQASGAAIMMPLLMNVMLTSFPPEKRGSAMGLFGLVMIFAPAIGPTLSGWIIQNYEWPMLFFMIAPIAFIILLIAVFRLHDKKESLPGSIDILSVIFSTFGFGGILYGFSSAGNKGWSDAIVITSLVVGVISLISLVWRQFKLEEPMLDFHVFKYPMFALSTVISFTLNMAMFSAMLLMPIYLQNIRGISPLDSGLLLLPGAIVMGIMSPITGRLFDCFGGRILAIIGLSITIVTTYFFAKLTLDTTYTQLIWLYSIRMFGISMVMMPVMTNGLNALPAKYTPHGTAVNSTIQQVSGAIGGSLLVTIMSNRSVTHGKEMFADAAKQLQAATSPEALAHLKELITMKATIEGINDAFLVSAFVAVIALIASFFIKRAKAPTSEK